MIIVAHPENIELLRKQLNLKRDIDLGISPKDFFIQPNSIPILTDEKLEKYTWTGKWIRTEVMSDDRFVCWIDDMDSPPSWAIFFGLVEKEMILNFYIVDKSYTFYNIERPQTKYWSEYDY